jgi:hypothetical protein
MRNTSIRISGDGLAIAGVSVFMLVCVSAAVACVAAWITHVVWIIKALASAAGATVGQMVLGALGAFMPPIGVIHGFMIWFGVGF